MAVANKLKRKLRFGQVGGGRDSFIGQAHRRAALADGCTELVAGALSATPDKARASGEDLFLMPERNYGSWQEMLEGESSRPAAQRIDFVSIATPNHVHFEPALAFVQNGFHVIIDKPMVVNSDQADRLIQAVRQHNVEFAVTYNYTGYPMVKQARHLVETGQLGEVQRIVVEYPQSWLLEPLEARGHKQASWRTDPARGISGSIADIGTHAENLMNYISRLEVDAVCADLKAFVPGRQLDDDASVLVRFANGARGILWASQVATGEENGLNIRVYGTRAGLSWTQENPNTLFFQPADGPAQVHKRGNPYLCDAATRASHIAAGLCEGFFEAFSNIYKNFTDTIRARWQGCDASRLETDFPSVHDGARGVRFVEKVVESAASEQKWTKV